MRKTLKTATDKLNTRLTRYATATGAMAAIASNLNAQVISSGNQDILVDIDNNYYLDLDGDEFDEFNFRITSGSDTSNPSFQYYFNHVYINGFMNSFIGSESMLRGFPYKLDSGYTIDSNNSAWINLPGVLSSNRTQIILGNPSYNSGGNFKDETGYIGIEFNIDRETHYGYVRVSVSAHDNTLTLHDWAYEATPNTPIITGAPDTTPPTITYSSVDEYTNESSIEIEVAFSEQVLGLNMSDFIFTNCSGIYLSEILDNKLYQLRIDPGNQGEQSITLPAGAITDRVLHENAESSISWIFDNIPPIAVLSSVVADRTSQETVQVSLSFDEEITGLTLSDISITNGSKANLVELIDGKEYTFEVTADEEGQVRVVLSSSTVYDLAGNRNNQITEISWLYDITAPNTTLRVSCGEITTVAAQVVTLDFNEEIQGLELSDLLLNNCSAANFRETISSVQYKVDITAIEDGYVGVELPASAVTDLTGIPNNTSALKSWVYDSGPPEVILDAGISETNEDTVIVSILFNEPITGLSQYDFRVTNAYARNLTEIIPQREYTIAIITSINPQDVFVELPLGAVRDLASNMNQSVLINWQYDPTPPVPSINANIGTVGVADQLMNISFNKGITDLDSTDFEVENGVLSNLTPILAGQEYSFNITAVSNGTVTISLPANAITDSLGNGNVAESDSWIYNGDSPSATIETGNPGFVGDQTVIIDILFDELISGLTSSDFVITNGSTGILHSINPGLHYSLEVTAEDVGIVTVELPAGTIADLEGNLMEDTSLATWEYTLPPYGIVGPENMVFTNEVSHLFNIQFSEVIIGLEISDFSCTHEHVTNTGSITNLIENTPGLNYTVEVTAPQEGMTIIRLPDTAVTNLNGLSLADPIVFLAIFDWTAPSINQESDISGITSERTVELQIRCNEKITGLSEAAINLTNCVIEEISPSTPSSFYRIEVSALQEGPVSVEFPAGTIVDMAGNPSEQSTNISWVYEEPSLVTFTPHATCYNEESHTLNISFSEAISGLEPSDFDIRNGSITNFTELEPGTEYALDITALETGHVVIDLLENSYTNLEGLPQAEGARTGWTYDTTTPGAHQMEIEWRATHIYDPNTFGYILFDDAIADFSFDKLVTTNCSIFDGRVTMPEEEYDYRIIVDYVGEFSVSIPAGTIHDCAGNPNETITVSCIYINEDAPFATLSTGITEATDSASVTVSVIFNEPISELDLSDFSITNGNAHNLVEVIPNTEYKVDIIAINGGLVEVNLLGGAVSNAEGIRNGLATTSFTYNSPINSLWNNNVSGIQIYPNPTSNLLHIELKEVSEIRILNTMGQLVLLRDSVKSEKLDLSHLAAGSYILHICNPKGTFSETIIIE